MSHTEALAALYQEYDLASTAIAEKTTQLQKYRDDYKALKQRLRTLSDKIEHPALIPLGSKALATGKIVHTNEITCMLGDNWFMECSAKTACEVVDRRIKQINKHIEEQAQEKERLENWRKSVSQMILETSETDSMQIKEHVTDEDFDRMQKEHKESVRRYRSKEAEVRQQKTKEEEDEEMRKFWERLEELELEEELNEEEKTYMTKAAKKGLKVPDVTKKSLQKPSTYSPTAQTSKSEPMKGTKSALKSSTVSEKKPDRQVSFSSTPQIQELKPALDSDDYSEDELEQIVPTKPIGGVKDTVVERVPSLSTSMSSSAVPVSGSGSSATPSAEPGPSEESVSTKKVSLFKQRRKL